jgi:hypothetical protein
LPQRSPSTFDEGDEGDEERQEGRALVQRIPEMLENPFQTTGVVARSQIGLLRAMPAACWSRMKQRHMTAAIVGGLPLARGIDDEKLARKLLCPVNDESFSS